MYLTKSLQYFGEFEPCFDKLYGEDLLMYSEQEIFRMRIMPRKK